MQSDITKPSNTYVETEIDLRRGVGLRPQCSRLRFLVTLEDAIDDEVALGSIEYVRAFSLGIFCFEVSPLPRRTMITDNRKSHLNMMIQNCKAA
jgi:hypothetical protein